MKGKFRKWSTYDSLPVLRRKIVKIIQHDGFQECFYLTPSGYILSALVNSEHPVKVGSYGFVCDYFVPECNRSTFAVISNIHVITGVSGEATKNYLTLPPYEVENVGVPKTSRLVRFFRWLWED